MAVVIASNLRKELAGSVLFDGVSFSVERRDRVALSGPNGAGKTTLLRILAGETEKHGGELAFAKGTRVALHDQRPPLEQELTLREYVLAGACDLVALEDELRRLEQAGGRPVSWVQLICELQRDWNRKATVPAFAEILFAVEGH